MRGGIATLVAGALCVLIAGIAGCPPSGRPRPVAPAPVPSLGWDRPHAMTKVGEGGRCSVASDCASGICEGEGCGLDGGFCVAANRVCNKELRDYCGCDSVTFQASTTCPSARFGYLGACKRQDGDACLDAAECESGICEGLGCGTKGGVCVERERMCAQVVTDFCGCDGSSFQSATSCAGTRYASLGRCTPKPDGAPCLAAADCVSGVCEGRGCDASTPGVCAPAQRSCTKDRRAYCGCDRVTFYSSGSCPRRRFQSKGACRR